VSLLVYKVSKWIQGQRILDRISLFLPEGCLATLLGPSGSGKSTLLRVIAGLEKDATGSIWLNGRDHTQTPIQYRRMGFVFQSFALFPYKTAEENISFGLQLRYSSQEDLTIRVNLLLEALRIKDIARQYPHQLSGGQKQRVALARSLIVEPQFLLLDEPFKALDNELRNNVSRWLQGYLKEKHITALMVTHDPREAIVFSDEILVLRHGRLVQQGTPAFIYDNPINDFVGDFFGPLIPVQARLWSIVTLRSHELTLTRYPRLNSYLAMLTQIVYKKQIIEITMKLIPSEQFLRLEVGYKVFKELHITHWDSSLYLYVSVSAT